MHVHDAGGRFDRFAGFGAGPFRDDRRPRADEERAGGDPVADQRLVQ